MTNTFTRRQFLQSASILAGSVAWPAWMPRLSFAPKNEAPRGDTLVVIFLRGAADVFNMIVPHGEPAYYRARPTLSLAQPDNGLAPKAARAVDLDGFFGLHPTMQSLLPVWQAQQLAIVHACGAPDESRSHFKAMELMERGVEDERGPASGWIGRHLATLNAHAEGMGRNRSPLRAIGLGSVTQRSLSGAVPVTALQSIADFHLGGNARAVEQMRATLSSLYTGTEPLSVIGQETLDVLDTLQVLDPAGYIAGREARYPDSEFGLGLRQVAMLIKAEVGLEVAALDVGGWDTHFAQGVTDGWMPGLMQDLADGLAAFHADMFDHADKLTVVVMSEFGRRLTENASLGTDHGHGSAMLLMGGHVLGGRVHGQWPGLAEGQLVGPGDLAVTTDYRDVLAELCAKRLNNHAVGEIFPGYSATLRDVLK